MRPNLEFADADPGPLGPKVFHFAKGDVPVVQGAANISAPPDSWVAAENLESEFDKFLPFRKKLVRRSKNVFHYAAWVSDNECALCVDVDGPRQSPVVADQQRPVPLPSKMQERRKPSNKDVFSPTVLQITSFDSAPASRVSKSEKRSSLTLLTKYRFREPEMQLTKI